MVTLNIKTMTASSSQKVMKSAFMGQKGSFLNAHDILKDTMQSSFVRSNLKSFSSMDIQEDIMSRLNLPTQKLAFENLTSFSSSQKMREFALFGHKDSVMNIHNTLKDTMQSSFASSNLKSFSSMGIQEDIMSRLNLPTQKLAFKNLTSFTSSQEVMESALLGHKGSVMNIHNILKDTMQSSFVGSNLKSFSSMGIQEDIMSRLTLATQKLAFKNLTSFSSSQKMRDSVFNKLQNDITTLNETMLSYTKTSSSLFNKHTNYYSTFGINELDIPSFLQLGSIQKNNTFHSISDNMKQHLSINTSKYITDGFFNDFNNFNDYRTSKSYKQLLEKHRQDTLIYKHIKSIENDLLNIESPSFQDTSSESKTNLYQNLNSHLKELINEKPFLGLVLVFVINKVLDKIYIEFIFLLSLLLAPDNNKYTIYQEELTTQPKHHCLTKKFKNSKIRTVSSTLLHIRKSKSMNNQAIIGRLFQGTKVEVHYKDKNWCYIKYQGKNKSDSLEGWTNTRYLKK